MSLVGFPVPGILLPGVPQASLPGTKPKPPTPSGVPPVNTVAPTTTSDGMMDYPMVGDTLTVAPGTWTGTPAPTLSYKWQRNGVDISGASGTVLTIQESYIGGVIKPVETAENASGTESEDGDVSGSVIGSAFIQDGAGSGALNNSESPYATPNAALVDLKSTYSGQIVGLRFTDSLAADELNTESVLGLTGLVFVGQGGVQQWDWVSFNLSGSSTGNDEDGGPAFTGPVVFSQIASASIFFGAGGTAGASTLTSGEGHVGGNGIPAVYLLNTSSIGYIGIPGGDGGQGGPGDELTGGGSGGNGGNGGSIFYDATSSASGYNLAGGAGGAGGDDFGAGAGNPGSDGIEGSYTPL